jgi:hypothetical protein
LLEKIDGVFDTIPQPFNEVGDEEEASAIESVVAMHGNETRFLLCAHSIDEVDEDFNFVGLLRGPLGRTRGCRARCR